MLLTYKLTPQKNPLQKKNKKNKRKKNETYQSQIGIAQKSHATYIYHRKLIRF